MVETDSGEDDIFICGAFSALLGTIYIGWYNPFEEKFSSKFNHSGAILGEIGTCRATIGPQRAFYPQQTFGVAELG